MEIQNSALQLQIFKVCTHYSYNYSLHITHSKIHITHCKLDTAHSLEKVGLNNCVGILNRELWKAGTYWPPCCLQCTVLGSACKLLACNIWHTAGPADCSIRHCAFWQLGSGSSLTTLVMSHHCHMSRTTCHLSQVRSRISASLT